MYRYVIHALIILVCMPTPGSSVNVKVAKIGPSNASHCTLASSQRKQTRVGSCISGEDDNRKQLIIVHTKYTMSCSLKHKSGSRDRQYTTGRYIHSCIHHTHSTMSSTCMSLWLPLTAQLQGSLAQVSRVG